MIDLGAIDFFEWLAVVALVFLLFGIIKITLYSYSKEKRARTYSSPKSGASPTSQDSEERFQIATTPIGEKEEKIELVEIKRTEGVKVRGHIYSYSKKKKPVFIGQVEGLSGFTPLTAITEEEFDLDSLVRAVRNADQEKKAESR